MTDMPIASSETDSSDSIRQRLRTILDDEMTGLIPAEDIYAAIGSPRAPYRSWGFVKTVKRVMAELGWNLQRRRSPYQTQSVSFFCRGDENHIFKWSSVEQAFVTVDDPATNPDATS